TAGKPTPGSADGFRHRADAAQCDRARACGERISVVDRNTHSDRPHVPPLLDGSSQTPAPPLGLRSVRAGKPRFQQNDDVLNLLELIEFLLFCLAQQARGIEGQQALEAKLRALRGMIRQHLLWRGALRQKLQDFRSGGCRHGLTTHERELQDRREPRPEGLEALSQVVRDVKCHLYHSNLLADALSLGTWVSGSPGWQKNTELRHCLRGIGA